MSTKKTLIDTYRVQESDSNFFESFTALSWRQENKRLRAASDEDHDRHPPSESQFAIKPEVQRLSKKEFELLYIEVLYTIKHKIGTTAGGHLPYIQDLYQYAQEAFRISPEDHARLLAKATEEKPPIVILNVTVIKARDLEAKDADGFSDPYCMLGIMPGRLLDQDLSSSPVTLSDEEDHHKKEEKKRGGSLRKFSLTKKKKDKTVKELLPAKLIKTTDVKPNTVNPVWEEKFRFDLDDVRSDRLHLDIWDHDDEFSVIDAAKKLNEVQSMKGLGRFFKQVAQSARPRRKGGDIDDFLGCVTVPIKDIPSTGVEKYFQLHGRSSKSNIQGEIKLRLQLATREDRGLDEDDNWTDVRQHEDLICLFIEHEVRRLRESPCSWNGNLPKAATTILHQHAIQGDVTDVQQAVCRWMAYSRKHMEYAFSYELLLKLLEDLDHKWTADSLSREEEQCLNESFSTFKDYCTSLIKKRREVYPYSNKHALNRLHQMIKVLVKIYSMKVFKYVCPFAKELHSEIITVAKRGTLEWYERAIHMAKKQSKRHTADQEEDIVYSLIDLTNCLNADLYGTINEYQKIFNLIANMNYFSITYKQLEKLLGEEFTNCMKKTTFSKGHRVMEGMLGTTYFELYLALQEFCNYGWEHLPENHDRLEIEQYYKWFRFAVTQWISVAQDKAVHRIHKAIELDKTADVGGAGAKFSTSAVDVCCCFSQISEFWRQLAWPDLIDSYSMVSKLTKDMCECARIYADSVHQKLIDKGYYDEEGQFDVTEQICITINNIEQVRRALRQLPETMNFVEIQHAVEQSNEIESKENLHTTVREADQIMLEKIQQVVDRVADKMRPDIKSDVFHLNWAPESVPAEEAVEDLMKYLDSNLLTLNQYLLKSNFDRILQSIWVEVLEEFNEVLVTEESRTPVIYKRMYEALGLLVDFFHADEKGLEMKKITSEEYIKLKKLLSLYKKDTLKLITMFYEEKLKQQAEFKSKEYGVLNVRMCYRNETETMFVEILNAKAIIPLDANGFSDPYVLIQFCPEHIFHDVPVQKTSIKKKTLNPVFDESFEFNVSIEQCRKRGAVLMFTVMDHDYVFENDFAGEAYVDLCNIPGVDGQDVSGFDSLAITALPLMQPQHKVVLVLLQSSRWFESDLPPSMGGYVHPAFQKVYNVFKKNIETNKEKGACFSAYYKGELVVDLWGGYSDIEAGRPWQNDTLSIMFSTTKGVTAVIVALFVQRGYLDYKKRVSCYWPEFGKNGKENITVEMLLSHQAGLSITNGTIDIRLLKTNQTKVEEFLEEQKPIWKPGTAYSYHVITFGMYVDVLLRKADPKHRNVDQIFKEEIAEPFDIDIHYGMPRSELYRNSRFVPLSLTNIVRHTLQSFSLKQFNIFFTLMDPTSMFTKASYSGFNQELTFAAFNNPDLNQIPLTSFLGFGNSRSLAKLWGILANGGTYNNNTLLNPAMINLLGSPLISGRSKDGVLDTTVGRGVFFLPTPQGHLSFGHPGYGGQTAYADVQNNVGIGYLTSYLKSFTLGDDVQFLEYEAAFYECLEKYVKGNT
ncbi:BAI1-associated protein 3-like [Saccostrea echinata]|uniref:BAI1-associated protein 3-like n=1 Tax=Saccostrea echinata TaxID=191078 RepID=UPI002A82743D|nr:BAI1-associated protein 3-like [Saccostrea echinata]